MVANGASSLLSQGGAGRRQIRLWKSSKLPNDIYYYVRLAPGQLPLQRVAAIEQQFGISLSMDETIEIPSGGICVIFLTGMASKLRSGGTWNRNMNS